jgi:hypothetical protein
MNLQSTAFPFSHPFTNYTPHKGKKKDKNIKSAPLDLNQLFTRYERSIFPDKLGALF